MQNDLYHIHLRFEWQLNKCDWSTRVGVVPIMGNCRNHIMGRPSIKISYIKGDSIYAIGHAFRIYSCMYGNCLAHFIKCTHLEAYTPVPRLCIWITWSASAFDLLPYIKTAHGWHYILVYIPDIAETQRIHQAGQTLVVLNWLCSAEKKKEYIYTHRPWRRLAINHGARNVW